MSNNFSTIDHLISTPKKNKMKLPFSLKNLAILAVFVAIAVVVTSYYQSSQTSKFEAQKLEEEKKLEESDPKKFYLDKISKLIDLPSEEPTMMTVTEKEKLAENPFFKRADNEDKVFVYKEAGKAIIYRPSSGKVIEYVSAVIAQDTPPTNSDTKSPKVAGASDSAKTSVKLSILNGTSTAGLAAKTESLITSKITNTSFEVLQKANANAKTYTKTQVVDVSKKFSSTAEAISKALNASVVNIPTGESAPTGTDILVIAAQ